MELSNEKCVMVFEEDLPLGVIANTAGILGFTLGKHMPENVGSDVLDRSGNVHRGIVKLPVPILKAKTEKIKTIREQLYQPEFSSLTVVDFSDIAQSCNTYEDYIQKAAHVPENEFIYYGIAICGSKKLVNKLTGNLPLLR